MAGAGAGKTEFLAQKAAYLLQTGLCPRPRRILAISFKRDAAQNLAARVRLRCPDEGHRFVSVTFDAFSKGIVDQFRMAIPPEFRPPSDYEISFPTRDIVEDFLNRHNFRDFSWQHVERAVTNTQLPLSAAAISQRMGDVLEAYWRDQYFGGNQAYLTFPMINRLVDYLVRMDQQIRSALRSTYPVVFLDEFQDTTSAQFQVLGSVFLGSSSVFTAVGDDKQRIMGWAGAMENSFSHFTRLFNARPISLLSNWRSNPELVAIQHLIASRIDPAVEHTVAHRTRQVAGDVAAVWQFGTREAEVSYFAEWISSEIDDATVEAHDIAILVRNYADRVEQELSPAMIEHGISVRNVARLVGGVAIQDLLAEELTALLLPFLRLGAKRRDSIAWALVQHEIQRINRVLEDDEVRLQALHRETEKICRDVRDYMTQHQPADADSEILSAKIIGHIGESRIRQSVASYGRDRDFARVCAGFNALLKESCNGGGSWSDALDRFEGKGQVPIMTVHKSKGLEFHSMIFFGLDNQSWWSLKPNNDEELKSFFVAFTRAQQRAFFTCCSERGGRISWLDNLLGDTLPRQHI
jgi:superfamily I DNA/RNA helicase